MPAGQAKHIFDALLQFGKLVLRQPDRFAYTWKSDNSISAVVVQNMPDNLAGFDWIVGRATARSDVFNCFADFKFKQFVGISGLSNCRHGVNSACFEQGFKRPGRHAAGCAIFSVIIFVGITNIRGKVKPCFIGMLNSFNISIAFTADLGLILCVSVRRTDLITQRTIFAAIGTSIHFNRIIFTTLVTMDFQPILGAHRCTHAATDTPAFPNNFLNHIHLRSL